MAQSPTLFFATARILAPIKKIDLDLHDIQATHGGRGESFLDRQEEEDRLWELGLACGKLRNSGVSE